MQSGSFLTARTTLLYVFCIHLIGAKQFVVCDVFSLVRDILSMSKISSPVGDFAIRRGTSCLVKTTQDCDRQKVQSASWYGFTELPQYAITPTKPIHFPHSFAFAECCSGIEWKVNPSEHLSPTCTFLCETLPTFLCSSTSLYDVNLWCRFI